jgi:hypothetical protein
MTPYEKLVERCHITAQSRNEFAIFRNAWQPRSRTAGAAGDGDTWTDWVGPDSARPARRISLRCAAFYGAAFGGKLPHGCGPKALADFLSDYGLEPGICAFSKSKGGAPLPASAYIRHRGARHGSRARARRCLPDGLRAQPRLPRSRPKWSPFSWPTRATPTTKARPAGDPSSPSSSARAVRHERVLRRPPGAPVLQQPRPSRGRSPPDSGRMAGSGASHASGPAVGSGAGPGRRHPRLWQRAGPPELDSGRVWQARPGLPCNL